MGNVIFNPDNHEYRIDGEPKIYPSVTQILSFFRMTPDYETFGNDTAKYFGSAAHRLCALYDLNDLGEYDPKLEPWLNGYKKFLDDQNPKWELIEEPMISVDWGFAGTPDRVGTMAARTSCLDIKFGAEIPAHELQTGGYQVLYEETFKGSKLKDRYSLYVLPDDYRLIPHNSKADRVVFLGLVNAYSWAKRKKVIK